jgi:hypothetical protein
MESAVSSQRSAVGGQRSTGEKKHGGVEARRQGKEDEVPDIFGEISKSPMARQVGRTLVRELTRGLFGVLGGRRR